VLASVDIENFRCIKDVHLDFDPEGTGILGKNASGKTSLLEALYFLGHGRSLRTNVRGKLLREGSSFFRIVSNIQTSRGSLVAGVEFANDRTRIRLAGADVASVSEVAEILPIQLIDPGVHRLVEEGSARRRRLLDWGVFHVEPNFLQVWRRYQRALLQRNAALRAQLGIDVIAAWERELVQCGEIVDRAREAYAATLKVGFEAMASALLQESATLAYRRGWPEQETLEDALVTRRRRDQQIRTTTAGPHRSDLVLSLSGGAARDRVSRGQQKLLACALILAQVELRARRAAVPTCLLLDDPAAELDVDNLGKLLAAIAKIPAQLVVTSVSPAGLEGINIRRMFHVEQGALTRML